MRHMVVIVPELTGYASIRHVAVSLPYAAQLINGVKYMLPSDVKSQEGNTDAAASGHGARRRFAPWSSWRCDANQPRGSARDETPLRPPATAPG